MLGDQMLLSPDYTFGKLRGRTRKTGWRTLQRWRSRKHPGRAYNPIFIHGGVGLGKTHLLQGICQEILRKRPSTAICLRLMQQFHRLLHRLGQDWSHERVSLEIQVNRRPGDR